MKLVTFLLLGLAAVAALCRGAASGDSGLNSDRLTVRTSTGSFTGFVDPEFPNTRQWRSIPFAEPPVGARRWLPPQKPSARGGHQYATKYPPSCPQFVTAVESIWSMPLTKGNLIYNGAQNDSSGLVGEATSEDCLYLAVWAPSGPPPKGGFPILFFMTGGGNVIGGIDLPWQIPTSWVERSQSSIIVSINYRMNIFGFPRARGLDGEHQNLGILDQRAALEWVRDNIANFGGNPRRIMQWGRSSGAVSADIHAYAYHKDPIAQSYYLESGSAFVFNPLQDPTYSNFSFVARNVGCADPCGPNVDCEDHAKAELDCMRRVSANQITNFIGQYGDRGERPGLLFSAIRDDRLIFRDYRAQSEAGKLARRPTMISFTANEMSVGAPWPKDNLTEGPWQPPITAADLLFACGTRESTLYRNRLGDEAPVFRWQYAGVFPNLNVYKWLGAYHNSETPLVFGTYRLMDHIAPTTDFQVEVSESIQDHIIAFAEDPYNGPQDVFGWEPQNASAPNGGIVLRFGSKGKAVQKINGHEIDGACLGLGVYDPFP